MYKLFQTFFVDLYVKITVLRSYNYVGYCINWNYRMINDK